MFTLDAEFENSDGRSQHLRIKHFDPTKTGEEIKASLTKLTKLNLFEKNGVGLFKKVKHATLIDLKGYLNLPANAQVAIQVDPEQFEKWFIDAIAKTL